MGQVSENRNSGRIISDRYFKEWLQLVSFIAGMCGQIPSQSQIRKSMQENGNAVCGQRLANFLTMGRKNALSCSLFFFLRHSPLIMKFTDPT